MDATTIAIIIFLTLVAGLASVGHFTLPRLAREKLAEGAEITALVGFGGRNNVRSALMWTKSGRLYMANELGKVIFDVPAVEVTVTRKVWGVGAGIIITLADGRQFITTGYQVQKLPLFFRRTNDANLARWLEFFAAIGRLT